MTGATFQQVLSLHLEFHSFSLQVYFIFKSQEYVKEALPAHDYQVKHVAPQSSSLMC